VKNLNATQGLMVIPWRKSANLQKDSKYFENNIEINVCFVGHMDSVISFELAYSEDVHQQHTTTIGHCF
jgi:hypothetical protein